MKKYLIALLTYSLLTYSLPAIAAGGGGGGSVPTCDLNLYSCTDWDACSPQGARTRSCIQTFSCPGATNQKPTETQTCTPSCTADTWTCGSWNECSAQGSQTRTCQMTTDCINAETPKPIEQQSCTPAPTPGPAANKNAVPTLPPAQQPRVIVKPVEVPTRPICTADTWRCDAWSACDIDGVQKRQCAKTAECPAAHTQAPPQLQRCQALQCGNKATIRDRIICRLFLSPAGIARELEIQYLPEECRAETDKKERQECVARYKSFQPCWQIPAGENRFVCARNVLKLGPTISDEVKTCQGKTGRDQAACKAALKEKTLYMIKFRFYDLEQRAEDLILRGASANTTADFVAFVEKEKQMFNTATTKQEQKRMIRDVQDAWMKYIAAVKDHVVR